MNLPYNLFWGVDVAVKKLRPNAKFELTNNTFTHWEDPNGMYPPSWNEINEQIEKDKLAAEIWLEKNQE